MHDEQESLLLQNLEAVVMLLTDRDFAPGSS